MKSSKLSHYLLLGAILTLASCETLQSQVPPIACSTNCQVEVDLPANPGGRPSAAPTTLRVEAGRQINFVVRGGQAGKEATELVFENETPLLDGEGRPVYIVTLGVGSNRFPTRPISDGVCQGTNGCKYHIVNSGNPQSRPLDPWIILE